MSLNVGMTITYDAYAAYAKSIGVQPYTRQQFDTMSPVQKLGIATLMRNAKAS